MDWYQFGDVMLNVGAARRLRFNPEATNDQPAPTVVVEFDANDIFTLHGEQASKLWYLYETRETLTRKRPVICSEENIRVNKKLESIRMSSRSTASDDALSIFDFKP